MEVIEWHPVAISAKNDQAVKEHDGSVTIPWHWVAIDHTQFRLSLQVECLIDSLHLVLCSHAAN